MEPTRLVREVLDLMPGAPPAEVLRMAMLMCFASEEDGRELNDSASRSQLFHELQLQLSMHEDQHAAIASEIDSLASSQPCQFSPTHLWTLVRAIKVQSQLLNFYLGPEAASRETAAPR